MFSSILSQANNYFNRAASLLKPVVNEVYRAGPTLAASTSCAIATYFYARSINTTPAFAKAISAMVGTITYLAWEEYRNPPIHTLETRQIPQLRTQLEQIRTASAAYFQIYGLHLSAMAAAFQQQQQQIIGLEQQITGLEQQITGLGQQVFGLSDAFERIRQPIVVQLNFHLPQRPALPLQQTPAALTSPGDSSGSQIT